MVHCGIISFCGKNALNIKESKIKQDILEDIEEHSGIKIIQKHYNTLNSTNIQRINQEPRLITLRSNGNPYLLFFTQLNFVNQCIFIDKKVQQSYFLPRMIISRFEFDDDLFSGTLIDGEMIKQDASDDKWIYLIHDIFMYKNRSMGNVNLPERLQLISDILLNNFKTDKNDFCSIMIKKYVQCNEILYLLNTLMPSLSYTCRGLYIKSAYGIVKDFLYNFNDELIVKVQRQKLQTEGTFMEHGAATATVTPTTVTTMAVLASKTRSSQNAEVMFIMKTDLPDVYTVVNSEGDDEGYAFVNTLEISKYMNQKFKNCNLTEKLQMPCEFDSNFQKWKPIVT
jgi:hypothetical protein